MHAFKTKHITLHFDNCIDQQMRKPHLTQHRMVLKCNFALLDMTDEENQFYTRF